MLSRKKVQTMYQSGAKHYDFTTFLIRLIGLRMKAYRQLAIKKLSLERDHFVIELGCGTGLNFTISYGNPKKDNFHKAIFGIDKIIGFDMVYSIFY